MSCVVSIAYHFNRHQPTNKMFITINLDAIVPALSLEQCVRILSNQWLTDEVI